MNWNEYVESIIEEVTWLDKINVCLPEDEDSIGVPSIIKASLVIIENFILSGNNKIVLVFPEKNKLSFLFALFKVIKDIYDGDVIKTYNPYDFIAGERLKYSNSIVEFSRIEIERSTGEVLLYIKCADLTYGVPIKYAPFFQKTDSQKRLSSCDSFKKIFKIAEAKEERKDDEQDIISVLKNYKTHMSGPLIYISQINSSVEMLSKTEIKGVQLQELLLTGKLDYYGGIDVLGSGQLSGIPTFVIGNDLYSVIEANKEEVPIKSVVIDVSSTNFLNAQLDAIDTLINKNLPLICVTDTANSFNLESLKDRGFDIWRWDKESLLNSMHNTNQKDIDNKIQNCLIQKNNIIECHNVEINEIMQSLYFYKGEIMELPSNIGIKLFYLAFLALRTVKEYSSQELVKMQEDIEACSVILLKEERFLLPILFKEVKRIIENLKIIFSGKYIFSKALTIQKIVEDNRYEKVCLIVPDRINKISIAMYWETFLAQKGIKCKISVFYSIEYYNFLFSDDDVVIVSGWLSNATMRSILNCNNNRQYAILVNDYETKWQKSHMKWWSKELSNGGNNAILSKIAAIRKSNVPAFDEVAIEKDTFDIDELEQLELTLSVSRYKQYTQGVGDYSIGELVPAIPISYTGDFLAFYRLAHKVITVTDIILNSKSDIKIKLPKELEICDFVVMRESERDIIKELADIILKNSGKEKYIEQASRWKNVLEIERVFCSDGEIIEKLRNAGCKKETSTMRLWLRNDELIMPQSKEDLKYIAEAMEDDVLLEQLDAVFEAGKVVKKAHVQAGMHLSNLLKTNIAEKLRKMSQIDPYNIWDPILLEIEDIGKVSILKIIDIGKEISIEATNTNRLIEG